MDYSHQFQNLIDLIGGPELLCHFALFQGRDDCQVFIPDSSSRSIRNVKVASDFTGIAYDGAHWKGYENGVVKYDSYVSKIQLPKTNNYCQSYATYLWAKRGKMAPFIPNQYAKNAQLMSKEWLKYFDDTLKYPNLKAWLMREIKGYDLKLAIETLQLIARDINVAREFSTSKEDSI